MIPTEYTPEVEARIKERRDSAKPNLYCSLMNSAYCDCDTCRRKVSFMHNGESYFCLKKFIEDRFYHEMMESKRNIQIGWSNNWQIEAKEIERKERDIEGTDCGVGVAMDPVEETTGKPMAMDGEEAQLSTEDTVGECCNC